MCYLHPEPQPDPLLPQRIPQAAASLCKSFKNQLAREVNRALTPQEKEKLGAARQQIEKLIPFFAKDSISYMAQACCYHYLFQKENEWQRKRKNEINNFFQAHVENTDLIKILTTYCLEKCFMFSSGDMAGSLEYILKHVMREGRKFYRSDTKLEQYADSSFCRLYGPGILAPLGEEVRNCYKHLLELNVSPTLIHDNWEKHICFVDQGAKTIISITKQFDKCEDKSQSFKAAVRLALYGQQNIEHMWDGARTACPLRILKILVNTPGVKQILKNTHFCSAIAREQKEEVDQPDDLKEKMGESAFNKLQKIMTEPKYRIESILSFSALESLLCIKNISEALKYCCYETELTSAILKPCLCRFLEKTETETRRGFTIAYQNVYQINRSNLIECDIARSNIEILDHNTAVVREIGEDVAKKAKELAKQCNILECLQAFSKQEKEVTEPKGVMPSLQSEGDPVETEGERDPLLDYLLYSEACLVEALDAVEVDISEKTDSELDKKNPAPAVGKKAKKKRNLEEALAFYYFALEDIKDNMNSLKKVFPVLKDLIAKETDQLKELQSTEDDIDNKAKIIIDTATKAIKAQQFTAPDTSRFSHQYSVLKNEIEKIMQALSKSIGDIRREEKHNQILENFISGIPDRIRNCPLAEGFGQGDHFDGKLQWWMYDAIKEKLHNRIITPAKKVKTFSGRTHLLDNEALALYVTNSSRTPLTWFCISVHRWVLKPDVSGSAQAKTGYVDETEWEDMQKLPGNSTAFYVLHIPWPK